MLSLVPSEKYYKNTKFQPAIYSFSWIKYISYNTYPFTLERLDFCKSQTQIENLPWKISAELSP